MTENAARPNEAEWRELFEHSPLMYFMVDAAGIVLSLNDSGAAALGYQVDELVGQSVLKVFFGSERERVRRNLDLCLERPGQLNAWEAQKIRKDGTTLWVGETAKAVERARGDVVVLISREDITRRKRAEEAARESAKRFRALIEHAYVVLLLDRDCGILYASPSVERVLGLRRENWSAATVSILSIPANSKTPGTNLPQHWSAKTRSSRASGSFNISTEGGSGLRTR